MAEGLSCFLAAVPLNGSQKDSWSLRSLRARAKRAREKSLKAFRYSPTKKNTPDGGFRHGGHGRARDTRNEIFFFFGKDARKTKRPRRYANTVINKCRRPAGIRKSESRFLDRKDAFSRVIGECRGFSVKILSGVLDTGYTGGHGIHGKKFFFFRGKTSEKGKDSVAMRTWELF